MLVLVPVLEVVLLSLVLCVWLLAMWVCYWRARRGMFCKSMTPMKAMCGTLTKPTNFVFLVHTCKNPTLLAHSFAHHFHAPLCSCQRTRVCVLPSRHLVAPLWQTLYQPAVFAWRSQRPDNPTKLNAPPFFRRMSSNSSTAFMPVPLACNMPFSFSLNEKQPRYVRNHVERDIMHVPRVEQLYGELHRKGEDVWGHAEKE